MVCCIWLCTAVMAAILSPSTVAEKLKVLSFGGNGNIGSATLHQLIQTNRFDITMVTRGSFHWDSETRIDPHVRTVKCNRNFQPPCAADPNATDCDINAVRQCPDLMELIQTTEKFDLVLDFSGYEPKWVHDNCEVLKDRVGLYIYISTDSVYEVSRDKPTRRPSRETDAVRPGDEKEIKLLKRKDAYGHHKLACEEALVYYQEKKNGFPWVALRLSDVIGPRDTTGRWWTYQMWVKLYPEIDRPIYMPGHVATKPQSLTYVEDVGTVVLRLVELGPSVWNQAYNIALEGEFTLAGIIDQIKKGMGAGDEVIGDSQDSEKAFYSYPTVFSGPMDISKAKKMLGFEPTTTQEAIRHTIDFYEEAFTTFPEERDDVLSELFSTAIPKANRDRVYIAIDRELEKAGKQEEKYRKKRKGELGSLEEVSEEEYDNDDEDSSEEDSSEYQHEEEDDLSVKEEL